MPCEYAQGKITAQSDGAEQHHGLVRRYFVKPVAQLVHRDVYRSGYRAERVFLGCADVNQRHIVLFRLQFAPCDDRHRAADYVGSYIACDGNRVLGR